MSNRIDSMAQGLLGKIAEHTNGTAGTKKAGGAGASLRDVHAASPSGEDKVELTSSAKLLERLEKSFASIPEIDRSRVDAVKQAIENGEYEVNAEKIAASLIFTDRQLGS